MVVFLEKIVTTVIVLHCVYQLTHQVVVTHNLRAMFR